MQKKILHRSKEGSAKMILDSQELEFLKLCALARYMPCGLAGIFEMQILKSEVSGRLAKSGYLKYVNGGCKFSRLTRRGRDILLRAGYEFPDDARPHKKGNTFNRRVINAKLNAMLYGAGINIYAGTVQGLSREDCIYIPSLTIRSEMKSKVLAGTVFYGILRIGDTAYVLYYTDDIADGAFPDFEQQTFLSMISHIENIKNVAIIIAAETVEGLIGYLMPEKKPEITRGIVPFSELMERWQYDFYLLPMDKDGIMQIKLMCIDNYKKDIAAMFGDADNVPVKLSRFDAVCGGKACITAMDTNITRVRYSLEQSLLSGIIPNIICLAHQKAIYQHMAVYLEYPNQMKFTVVRHNTMTDMFPQLRMGETKIEPARTKDGEYLII